MYTNLNFSENSGFNKISEDGQLSLAIKKPGKWELTTSWNFIKNFYQQTFSDTLINFKTLPTS